MWKIFQKYKCLNLGRQLNGSKKSIAPSQVEAITKAPKSQTVGQMLSYNTVCGFATTQLKKLHCGGLIWVTGQTKASTELQWKAETEVAFQALKSDMHTALARESLTILYHFIAMMQEGLVMPVVFGCRRLQLVSNH